MERKDKKIKRGGKISIREEKELGREAFRFETGRTREAVLFSRRVGGIRIAQPRAKD